MSPSGGASEGPSEDSSGTSGSSSGGSSPSDAGLQAERTGLAWSRTSLGVTANAALLAAHGLRGPSPGPTLVLAVLALVLAAGFAVQGRRRAAALRRDPAPTPLAAGVAIPVLGTAVVVLAVVAGLVLLTTASRGV